MKLPTLVMSWNVCPPSKLNSSTPPSKPRLGSTSDASRLKFCRKVNITQLDSVAKTPGESSRLSLSAGGSLTHAAFGSESAGGDGSPVFEVCQKIPSGSIAFVAVHPTGNAGGVTVSKFSSKTVIRCEPGGHGGGLGAAAARISTRPHPATLFGGPDVPHCL